MKKVLFALLVLAAFISCNNDTTANNGGGENSLPPIPVINYSVGATFAHDTSFFLEGLEFYKGKLLESTGLNGKSRLTEYDLATGKISKQIKLDDKFFGEGITVFHDTLYQLTYVEGVVHVYDAKDFKKIKELPYKNGEGWGLTHDSTHLIGTNSGNSLYYYDPATFAVVKSVPITENGSAAININELEYVNGFIYANQWQYPYILKIDPVKGEVVAKMDLTSLVQKEGGANASEKVLNGIAYNPETKKFYVTGKNWSKIYELQFAF